MLTGSYYYDTRYPECPLTLPEMWENGAKQGAEKYITWAEPYKKLSHAEAYDQAMMFAKGLLAIGLKRGDTLCCLGSSGSDPALMFIACSSLGIKYMSNYMHAPVSKVLKMVVSRAKPEAVLIGHIKSGSEHESVCSSFTEVIEELSGEATAHRITHILYDRQAEQDTTCKVGKDWKSLTGVIELGHSISDDTLRSAKSLVQMDEPCIYTCSSGSTGEPKFVLLSAATYTNLGRIGIVNYENKVDVFGMPDIAEDEFVFIAQLVGNFALSTNLVVFPLLDFEDHLKVVNTLLGVIEKYRIELLYYGQATISQIVNNQECTKAFDLSSLKCIILAGTMTTQAYKQKLLQLAPLSGEAYGSTEFVGAISAKLGGIASRPASAGQPGPNVEFKIIDDEGNIVPVNTRGQVCLRGWSMFIEYKDQPELTAKARDKDGWFLTGDLASMDGLGYVYIHGRIASAQRWKVDGDVVYSISIESVLRTHPKIRECAVFGTPAEGAMGHELNYVIVPVPDSNLTIEELTLFSVEKMGSFVEWPVRVFFYSYEQLPKTSGSRQKMNKAKLQEEVNVRVAKDPLNGLSNAWKYF